MNTLEMAIELRKNPKLKAQCTVGDVTWKVKCINGSLMRDDENRPPEFLDMSDCILRHNNWALIEENKVCELYYAGEVELENGIGFLPNDKKPINDIYVTTSDGVLHTIRPIGKQFAIPTNDKEVRIIFKYNYPCTCICIK